MSRYGAVNRRRRRATCAARLVPFLFSLSPTLSLSLRRRSGRGGGGGGARVAGTVRRESLRARTRISADDRRGTCVLFSTACVYIVCACVYRSTVRALSEFHPLIDHYYYNYFN